MNKLGSIKIRGESLPESIIDIEGVIGLPEEWQFENQGDRVATYEKFMDSLEQIKVLNAPRVRVNIRSVGGSVEDALLIYEALCSLDAQVTTHCHGYVASAATIIAQAGAIRLISSGAMYLIHNSITAIQGNKEEAIRTVGLLSKTDQRIARIYADRSGSGVEIFEELMGRDGGRGEWLSPEETVGFGLADQIVEFSVIKNLGLKIRNFAKSIGLEMWQLSDDFPYLESREKRDLDDASAASASIHCSNISKTIDVTNADQSSDIEVDEVLDKGVLEASSLRLSVGPTTTEPREDPVLDNPRQSQNQGAYADDVEMFRSTAM